MSAEPLDVVLARDVANYYANPLGFVKYAFPWGQPGILAEEEGPDKWQAEFLEWLGEQVKARKFDGKDPVAPIQAAVSSGHGVGKSTLTAWLVLWIMSTRAYCQGTLTATTGNQLSSKTWAALKAWLPRCLMAHWFSINDLRMWRLGRPEWKDEWACRPLTCDKDNSEAFHGQHAKRSTSFYIFDEASGVPDEIHEAAKGGLTDGEPMIFQFGNPTRSVGAFYRACFGADRHRWQSWKVDSRESRFTNKALLEEWAQDYGEDSDYFRVRARGIPPRASDAQFIDHERVLAAQKRQVVVLPDEPLVAGVDLAWGGSDDNVVRFRRGLDARSIPPIKVKGEFTREPSVMVTRLADILDQEWNGHRIHTLFLDSAGISGPIGARLRQLGYRNVHEVNFGADSPSHKCRFYRDFMWDNMKQWLLNGAIDDSSELETDLIGPGIHEDERRQRIWLESKKDMKKRGLDSPDDGDALALTFAAPVRAERRDPGPSFVGHKYPV